MSFPSASRIFLVTLTVNVLIISLIYLMENGFWKPEPSYIRHRPVTCTHLWWPMGVTDLGPQLNVTGQLRASTCTYLENFEQPKRRLRSELEQFKAKVDSAQKERINATNRHKNQDVRTGHFQPIDFTKGYVISAFLDHRTIPSPSVRVLYVIPLTTPDLYCQTTCDGGSFLSVLGSPEFLYFYSPAHERCIWNQYVLHCHFPPECDVTDVSVTSSPCLTPTNQLVVIPTDAAFSPRASLGVCLNHIYNLKAKHIPQIVNYFETFLQFGGDFVYLYGTYNIDGAVRNALEYYVKKGVLRHYEWLIPENISSMYYFAQVLQNMDCNYRHMGDVQYLLYIDLDEAVYPLHHSSYHDLLSDLTTNTANQYDAAMFLERVNTYIGDVEVGKYTHTTAGFCAIHQSKSLVRPRYVLTLGVHTVEQTVRPFRLGPKVGRGTAVVFHQKYQPITCDVEGELEAVHSGRMNQTLWKWYPIIQQRRKQVLKELHWS